MSLSVKGVNLLFDVTCYYVMPFNTGHYRTPYTSLFQALGIKPHVA